MSYHARIICDSVSETGKRLTTFELCFPRIILAEYNTHRMFSRNSASSRAIPFLKQLERVTVNPFIPERFPINDKGMQPKDYIEIDSPLYEEAKSLWLQARDKAIESAKLLHERNIHKQIINRLLEPFQFHTVICTATEFDNFFKLRTDENAQYEIKRIAELMYEAYHYHEKGEGCGSVELWGTIIPEVKKLKVGAWHLPFISDEGKEQILHYISQNVSSLRNEGFFISSNFHEDSSQSVFIELQKRVSVAHCARVSYLTHDGKRDIEKDLELFEKLRTSGHWSPFEHVATPNYVENTYLDEQLKRFDKRLEEGFSFSENHKYMNLRSGNFIGWRQMRKEFQDENCTYFRKEEK